MPLAPTTLTSLNIPQAGKYVIVAKAGFTGAGGFVLCSLVAESDTDVSGTVVTTAGPLMVANNVVHDYAAAGSAGFACAASVGGVAATQIKITAIRVGNLTNSG